jgi:hypothetical protein
MIYWFTFENCTGGDRLAQRKLLKARRFLASNRPARFEQTLTNSGEREPRPVANINTEAEKQ